MIMTQEGSSSLVPGAQQCHQRRSFILYLQSVFHMLFWTLRLASLMATTWLPAVSGEYMLPHSCPLRGPPYYKKDRRWYEQWQNSVLVAAVVRQKICDGNPSETMLDWWWLRVWIGYLYLWLWRFGTWGDQGRVWPSQYTDEAVKE